jgi:hypothetical protein
VVSFPHFLNQNPVCIYILLRYVFQIPTQIIVRDLTTKTKGEAPQ